MIRADYARTVREKFPGRTRETIDQQLEEVEKYLTILSEKGESRFIPLTQPADEVWYEMIVQTSPYAELCEGLPGRMFIHHESIGMDEYASRVGAREAVRQFLEWIPDYTSRFGSFTQEAARHWSVVQFLQSELGMTLDQVNALVHEQA